MNRGVAISVGL